MRAERELRALAGDEAGGQYEIVVEEADDPREAILRRAADTDLVLMGLRRDRRAGRVIGALALAIAAESDVPLILIGARGARAPLRGGTG